jgi:hypothetical protein
VFPFPGVDAMFEPIFRIQPFFFLTRQMRAGVQHSWRSAPGNAIAFLVVFCPISKIYKIL